MLYNPTFHILHTTHKKNSEFPPQRFFTTNDGKAEIFCLNLIAILFNFEYVLCGALLIRANDLHHYIIVFCCENTSVIHLHTVLVLL